MSFSAILQTATPRVRMADDATPAESPAPPSVLAMSSAAGVEFLRMIAERQTSLEVELETLKERVGSLTASFEAFTAVMPRPVAYYIVTEQPEGAELLDVRRSVLAALALAFRRYPEQVQVRCSLKLAKKGGGSCDAMTVAVILVTLNSSVDMDPAAAATEFASMHVQLARCGTRVLETRTVMSEMESQYFVYYLIDDEVFTPVRAEAAAAYHHLRAVDALGWCEYAYPQPHIFECRLERWAGLTGFEWDVPSKKDDEVWFKEWRRR